jgi:hypothetical protein
VSDAGQPGVTYARNEAYNALGQVGTVKYLEYSYDDVGNITAVTDYVTSDNSRTFSHDELNRLRVATSNVFQPDHQIEYRYDKVGNITFNTRVGDYEYLSPGGRPHSVTRAGADTFEYDDNGNMVKKNGGQRTFVYDAENRVRKITTGGASVDFVYDHKGERVKKIQGGVETVYIGGLLEIRGGEVRKHYAAGGKKIATRIGATLYNTARE